MTSILRDGLDGHAAFSQKNMSPMPPKICEQSVSPGALPVDVHRRMLRLPTPSARHSVPMALSWLFQGERQPGIHAAPTGHLH